VTRVGEFARTTSPVPVVPLVICEPAMAMGVVEAVETRPLASSVTSVEVEAVP
jgi:hypothetical protein